jgi:hypothetical protein
LTVFHLEDIEKRQLILENRIDKIAQEKFATVDDLVNMSKLHAKENNDKFEQKIVALVNEKLLWISPHLLIQAQKNGFVSTTVITGCMFDEFVIEILVSLL